MELLLAIAGISLSVGAIGGMMVASRHVDTECEMAYLTGHVDGYGAAMSDLGEEDL